MFASFIISYLPSMGDVNSGTIFRNNYAKDINEWYGVNATPFTFGLTWIPYAEGENTNTLIEHNLFYNVSPEHEIISVKFSDTKVFYNTFKNDMGTSHAKGHLSIRSGSNSIVKGNFFLGTKGGIRLFGKNHKVFNNYIDSYKWGIMIIGGDIIQPIDTFVVHQRAENCIIANNTIVNTCTAIELGTDWEPAAEYSFGTNSFINNILYIDEELTECTFCSDSMMRFVEEYDPNLISADPLIWNNNKVYEIDNRPNAHPLSELETFKTNHSIGDTQIKTEDPSFEIIDGLYKLQIVSSMIDSGDAVSFVNKDMDGQDRVETLDIGADEYSTASIINKPLNPEDVGPSWINSGIGGTYSSYESFMNTVTNWKKWDLYDPIVGGNPAFIKMPNFNSGNSILQFIGIEDAGFTCLYRPEINRYQITSTDLTDNRPRRVSLLVQDFNEKDIFNIDETTTTAIIEKWIVKTEDCNEYLDVMGNGTEIQFNNKAGFSMYIKTNNGFETTISNGGTLTLSNDVLYNVKIIRSTIGKSETPCKVKYTIKPAPIPEPNRLDKKEKDESSLKEILNIHPNPFNHTATIDYTIDNETAVIMDILDMQGNLIKRLVDGVKAEGMHTITWQGTDKNNKLVQNGFYICRIQTETYNESKKIILSK